MSDCSDSLLSIGRIAGYTEDIREGKVKCCMNAVFVSGVGFQRLEGGMQALGEEYRQPRSLTQRMNFKYEERRKKDGEVEVWDNDLFYSSSGAGRVGE